MIENPNLALALIRSRKKRLRIDLVAAMAAGVVATIIAARNLEIGGECWITTISALGIAFCAMLATSTRRAIQSEEDLEARILGLQDTNSARGSQSVSATQRTTTRPATPRQTVTDNANGNGNATEPERAKPTERSTS